MRRRPLEVVPGDEDRGSEDDDPAASYLGHDHHVLDNFRADDHVLGGAGDDDAEVDRELPNSGGVADGLLRQRDTDHPRRLRPRDHAFDEQTMGQTRYNQFALIF